MKKSSAWLFYHGAKAGLTRREVYYLPIGVVHDQIACWMIEDLKHKQKNTLRDVFDF